MGFNFFTALKEVGERVTNAIIPAITGGLAGGGAGAIAGGVLGFFEDPRAEEKAKEEARKRLRVQQQAIAGVPIRRTFLGLPSIVWIIGAIVLVVGIFLILAFTRR